MFDDARGALMSPVKHEPGSTGGWRKFSMRSKFALVLACHFVCAFSAAQKPPGLSSGEVALLPLYCTEAMGMRPGSAEGAMGPNANHWFGLMGRSFIHMHHYCWALATLRRAKSPSTPVQHREGLITHAIGDLGYVISNSESTFVMLPEIYVTMGDAYAQLKRHDLAVVAYSEARQRKPDYWRPYSRWAEALLAVGDRKAALAILEEGMRAIAPAPNLRAQYQRLGGNPEKFMASVPKRASDPAASGASQAATLPVPAASSASN